MTAKAVSISLILTSMALGAMWMLVRAEAMLVCAVLTALWAIYLVIIDKVQP